MTRMTALFALAIAVVAAPAVKAGDIIAEWGTVKIPSPPPLKPVTLDAKTTALLILDLQLPGCSVQRRPRCAAAIPRIQTLHDAARATGAMLFYTFAGPGNPAEIAAATLAPRDGEWIAKRGPDKFHATDLEARLKARGIQSVIVTGTSASGVVFGVGSGAAQRGLRVIVPVDGMASDEPFSELFTAWHLAVGGPDIVTGQVTLTRSDMIRLQR